MEMADQQAANQKQHQRECDENVPEQSTIEKLASSDGKFTSNPTQIKTITNTCYDCLEHIFDYLDLQSLLKVSGTCKRFQIAAAAEFQDEHGKKTIKLTPSPLMGKHEIVAQSNSINVVGLKFCYPFLRYFGAKLSHLSFVEYMTFYCYKNLEQYINQYCADTLTSFEFHYRHCKQTFSMKNNPKPFKHVGKIVIEICDLHGPFAHINDMFPKLCHLVLGLITVGEDFTAAVSFPHLEHLDISLTTYFDFGLEHAANRHH